MGTSSVRDRHGATGGLGHSAPAVRAHRHRLRPAQRLLVALEGLMAACGLAGGAYLATHATSAMPMRYLEGTWFHTWRWPGIALFFFVGVCPALVALAAFLRLRVARAGHVCVGIGLLAWILLEAAWVVVSPALQIAVGAIGAAILVLGLREAAAPSQREVPVEERS
ncbi:MAG TPA: hypothetical protein VMU75_07965 [Acidimicrobiales bacterium]|nr:hypothetical protein [Acidimicrobiales bacterium]